MLDARKSCARGRCPRTARERTGAQATAAAATALPEADGIRRAYFQDMNKDDGRAGKQPVAHDQAGGAAPEQWVVDSERSGLSFSVRHIVIQQIKGDFARWGGTLYVDWNQPSLSSIEVWIDLASVTTGDTDRDMQVRSPEFLDVEHFPRATFRSGMVQLRNGRVTIDGRLDLHGVSRDVQVEADVEIEPTETFGEGTVRARYKARATIDRQSFGLHWNQDLDVGGIVVGDQVQIRADVQLARVPEAGHASAPRPG